MLPLSQFEGLWQPCVEQVYQYHFPITFAHFMSLSHILVILTVSQILKLLLYIILHIVTDLCGGL